MRKKGIRTLLCIAMAASALVMPVLAAEDTEGSQDTLIGQPFDETVNITFITYKPEIVDMLQEGADIFGEKYNVKVEVIGTNSSELVTQRYASGDPATLVMHNIQTTRSLAQEGKTTDLSDLMCAETGGKDYGYWLEDELKGLPFTTEAKGLLYNKTVIEELTGREFNPDDYVTVEEFTALLEELKEAGMEKPVILTNFEAAYGSHPIQQFYILQDGTEETAKSFLKEVNAGTASFKDNIPFQQVLDLYDVLIENNINNADPLSADYDINASYLGEGEAAFWLNGSWAWPDVREYAPEDSEFGLMHLPIDNEAVQGRIAAVANQYLMIDGEKASEDEQKAAKMLIDWYIFTPEGQDTLINKCDVVVPYTNITLEPSGSFNKSVSDYIVQDRNMDGVLYMPADHTSTLAPAIQAYLAGVYTREDLAAAFDDYWGNTLPSE